jgi:hypothetical protein
MAHFGVKMGCLRGRWLVLTHCIAAGKNCLFNENKNW